eukprot:CAMPEP_0119029802 /NCGR_PEP_ID=MMETSP1176-20130426/40706_1 /TAXON_ID=265551 /ORGANISM="Synedropsis recta cf, Strain CCMP1620" /LENGTH=769 /DNA_ID=CAMNT_0006986157 /DNA_START=18 /DNA_END=2327 /DNA_ORIENTATION=+
MTVDRVQITLHAQKLKNVAGAFKGLSDPYAVVTQIASEPGDSPSILGKTEVIKNNLSPHWVKTFSIDYEFSKPTRINVGVYDEVRKQKDNKPMGSAVFEVGEVLGSRGNIKAKKIKGGGTLFCRIQKASDVSAGTFHFELRGIKLKNVDGMFGKSDPFFEVSKQLKGGGGPSWQVVYRSEVMDNNLNPKWKPVSLDVNELCGNDRYQSVLITVKDWDKKGKHQPMGFFETSVSGLTNAKVHGGTGDPKSIDLSKAFKLKKKGKLYGDIVVTAATIEGGSGVSAAGAAPSGYAVSAAASASTGFASALGGNEPQYQHGTAANVGATTAANVLTPMAPPQGMPPGRASRPKFVDFLSGGLELQLSVAVDFTGSNGDPRKPGTLHYIDRVKGQLNDYEKALSAVGAIVGKYDSDQKFPMLGFGAKFRGIINHCFQLGQVPEVSGIKGMIDAYRGTFKSGLVMSGPTVFAEAIQLAAAQARSKQEIAKRIGQQAYHILLILTDGAVSDINQTKNAIQAASDAPLSIVIVGIGNADFSAMQFLDDFQSQQGAGRDIVQFVEFQRYQSNKIHLTQATLDEIPDQVVDYFHGRGLKPLPPIRGSTLSLIPEDDYNADEEIDLTLGFGEDGEITLDSGGMVDDTGYGDYNTFAGITPMAPPAASAPPAYNPAARQVYASQQGYTPQQGQQQGYPPQGYAPPQGQQQGYPPQQQQYGGQAPQVVAAVVAPPPQVFHVQLPPGVNAGQQLQLTNPRTQQPMIVTVPPGIPPGGVFPVPY